MKTLHFKPYKLMIFITGGMRQINVRIMFWGRVIYLSPFYSRLFMNGIKSLYDEILATHISLKVDTN